MDWRLILCYLHEEKYLEGLKSWLETKLDQSTIQKTLEEKGALELAKEAFFEGYELGRKRLSKENWDLWNQK